MHLDKVVYRIIADATTRFNNLRSGDVEVLDAVAATDVDALKADANLRLITSDSLGYQGITINLGNVDGVGKPPGTLAAPVRRPARHATRGCAGRSSMSLDRAAINQVVFRGQFTPGLRADQRGQPVLLRRRAGVPEARPGRGEAAAGQRRRHHAAARSAWSSATRRRTAASARRSRRRSRRAASTCELAPTEFSASLDQTDAGKYQLFQIGWSGRVDPDGNIANFVRTAGLAEHLRVQQPGGGRADRPGPRDARRRQARRDLYGQVITKLHEDAPLIYLYRQKNFTGVASKVVGVQMYGDGMLARRHRRLRRLGRSAMGRYVLRRLLESAVTLVLVTIVVFLGVRALPGDPARALAGEESDPATVAADPPGVRAGPAAAGAVRAVRRQGGHRRSRPLVAHRAAGGRDDRPRAAGDAAAGRRSPWSSRCCIGIGAGVVAAVRRRAAGGVGGQRAWPCSACPCPTSGSA